MWLEWKIWTSPGSWYTFTQLPSRDFILATVTINVCYYLIRKRPPRNLSCARLKILLAQSKLNRLAGMAMATIQQKLICKQKTEVEFEFKQKLTAYGVIGKETVIFIRQELFTVNKYDDNVRLMFLRIISQCSRAPWRRTCSRSPDTLTNYTRKCLVWNRNLLLSSYLFPTLS